MMLQIKAAKYLKRYFPQINSKTEIVKVDVPFVKIREQSIPEVKAFKKETYLSRLGKALIGKDPNIPPILKNSDFEKEKGLNFIEAGFEEAPCGARAYMFVCYDNVSDTLFVHENGYTDIDLSFLT